MIGGIGACGRALKTTDKRLVATVFALVLAAAVVLWPALHLGYSPDDFGALIVLRRGGLGWLLGFCTMDDYFRPLCAPVFLAFYKMFGAQPVPLRMAMLGLHLWAGVFIGLTAAVVAENAAAGLLAGFIYAVAPMHWESFASNGNVGQLASHALLWSAVWLWAVGQRPRSSIALAATALLFKEDAVVFAPIILLLDRSMGRKVARTLTPAAGLLLGYAALRLAALPLLEPTGDLFKRVAWPGLRDVHAMSWALLGPFGVAALAVCALVPRRRLFLFGAAVYFIGLVPYLPFNALALPDCHRWALSWAGLSIALGAAALLPAPARVAAWACAVVFAVSSGRAVRRHDPSDPLFMRRISMAALERALKVVERDLFPHARDGDAVLVAGFDPELGLMEAIEVLSPVRLAVAMSVETRRWRRAAGVRWRLVCGPDGPVVEREGSPPR